MKATLEAEVDAKGNIRLKDAVTLRPGSRVLVTVVQDAPAETAVLSEASLASRKSTRAKAPPTGVSSEKNSSNRKVLLRLKPKYSRILLRENVFGILWARIAQRTAGPRVGTIALDPRAIPSNKLCTEIPM